MMSIGRGQPIEPKVVEEEMPSSLLIRLVVEVKDGSGMKVTYYGGVRAKDTNGILLAWQYL